MRRFVVGFGVCAALVVIVLVGALAYVAMVGGRLDSEAESYAQASVTAITGHWDSQALLSRATDSLKMSMDATKTKAIFDAFGKLGPLSALHGCRGQASMFRSITGQPSRTAASYVCQATYRNGDATISLALVKQADAWLVDGLHVSSGKLQAPSAIPL